MQGPKQDRRAVRGRNHSVLLGHLLRLITDPGASPKSPEN
jgi:hypothetical protein